MLSGMYPSKRKRPKKCSKRMLAMLFWTACLVAAAMLLTPDARAAKEGAGGVVVATFLGEVAPRDGTMK
jgi:hypothetical protein